jgi:type I restriction enzyme, S subunit
MPLEDLTEPGSAITYGVVKPGDEGDVPFVRGGDIADGRIFEERLRTVTEEVSEQYRRTLLRGGELLMCLVGQPGQVAVASPRLAGANIARQVGLIRLRSDIDPHFVCYFLRSPDGVSALSAFTGGSVQQVINLADLRRVKVPMPPVAEQRRIVAILDEAFDGIATAKANAETSLRSARDFISIGYNAITESYDRSRWTILKVADVVAAHKGSMRTGPFGSQLLHSEFVDAGIAVLGIDNAVANEFRWDRRRYITEEKYRQLARYRVMPGDVLITIMGTCGRCAVVPDDIPLAINTKHLCCITLDRERCLPEFLHGYFLQDPRARDYLNAQAKGSIMAGLNMGIISELPVLLPPVQQQTEIVDRFDKLRVECERLAAIQLQKLSALDELKNSLLDQAFTGQLTSDRPARTASRSALQTTTPEFTANVIAFIHAQHERQRREKTFGHVKEQKALHLVEAIAKIDLGRHPMKDAAGPNDFQHMLKAEEWAKANGFFEMAKRGEGYEFRKLSAFDARMSSARQALGPYLPQLERVIDLLVPMDTEEAEVLATVHAAWNNLLIDGAEVTDGAIVSAAREGWHPDKLKIPEQKFRSAIDLIRKKGLVPDGTAKYVGGQQSLL